MSRSASASAVSPVGALPTAEAGPLQGADDQAAADAFVVGDEHLRRGLGRGGGRGGGKHVEGRRKGRLDAARSGFLAIGPRRGAGR